MGDWLIFPTCSLAIPNRAPHNTVNELRIARTQTNNMVHGTYFANLTSCDLDVNM